MLAVAFAAFLAGSLVGFCLGVNALAASLWFMDDGHEIERDDYMEEAWSSQLPR